MLCNKTLRYRRWYLAGVAFVAAFVGGWVTANTQYATTVDKGLVTAFNAVGQNLFGSAVFSATSPNPIIPGDPIRLFIDDDSMIPVAIDIFHPPGLFDWPQSLQKLNTAQRTRIPAIQGWFSQVNEESKTRAAGVWSEAAAAENHLLY